VKVSLLDWLFDLKTLSTQGADVEWRFARPLPAWVWVGVIVACFVVAAWSYSRLLGPRRVRTALAIMRGCSLVILAMVIAGPELVRQNERVTRDWVVVMSDRSASMGVADAPSTGSAATTREAQLRAALAGAATEFDKLAAERNVLQLGFDAATFDLPAATDAKPGEVRVSLGEPLGRRTLLAQCLQQTLRRVAARPVAGVVLLTDGRSPDQPGRSLLREFQGRRIPVFPVPLGNAQSLPDLAITRAEAPAAAFVGDKLPVTVEIESLGGERGEGSGARLQLVDDATGLAIEERRLDASGAGRQTMLVTPRAAGERSYTVRLIPDGRDLSEQNNVARVSVTVADRPIRVAYFDGYPRWEYRYLKNILVREESIRTSAMLLSSERRSIQDGNEILDALPRTAKEWQQFDVVVMGDVRPEVFSVEQISQLRSLVAERGAGLLWIGGSGSTPGAWRGTPLADLVPFVIPPQGSPGVERSGVEAWLNPVLVKPGAAADRYGVLRLSEDPSNPWPGELLSGDLGWPMMRWAQRITPSMLKPTAEVLATATPAGGGSASETFPLVMSMRYGAGRVVYVATDETWRYRYCRGEVLTERFWIPMVRLLARESLGRAGRPAVIAATPEQAQVGRPVRLTVRLLDQSLIERRPASLRVRLLRRDEAGMAAGRAVEVMLAPEEAEQSEASVSYAASWIASEPGRYSIESADALLAGLDITARLEVVAPDDELRFPQADHAALETIASETGGRVLDAAALRDLSSLLPNREVRTLGTPDIETLWDKPIVFALLLALLAIEWIGRRLIKLA